MTENEKKDNEVPEKEISADTEQEAVGDEAAPEDADQETPSETESAAAEAEAEAEVEAEAAEAVEEEKEVAEEEEEERVAPHDKVDQLMSSFVRDDIPDFAPGDTVKVHVKIIEGNKERIQVFEGVVIAIKHGGIDRTFTVRKTSWGVGVERTFFVNSKKLDKIEVVRRGRVRRAKLYYLRQRAGKSARIKERRMTKG